MLTRLVIRDFKLFDEVDIELCGPMPRYYEITPVGAGGGSGGSTALLTLGPPATASGRWPGTPSGVEIICPAP